jgi:outer membrane protein OmpA-like peptidoglycan-associated protein
MTRFGLGVLALVLTASVAHAEVAIEVGGTAGVHLFNGDGALGFVATNPNDGQKNSALFAARVGAYFMHHYGIEIESGIIPTEPNSTVFDVINFVLRAQLVYQLNSIADSGVVPFALIGGGLDKIVTSRMTTIIAENQKFEPYIGAGVKYSTGSGWGVRFDLRFLAPPAKGGGETLDAEMLFSLTRTFGGPKPVKKPVVEKKVDDDPDHDGIVGAADECPNEPEDKDGFEDADGCPDLDNDKDGIPDKDDKCPNEPETFNGYQDADGCPDTLPEKLKAFTGVIQGINFKLGAADLAPTSLPVLDKAIAVMAEFKDIKLEIQGHTDDQPLTSKAFADNTALSQARAESVKAYFVKKGIDASRMTAKGFGETQPVTDPKGLTGAPLNAARAKNRRVEFKLISAAPAVAPTTAPAAPPPAAVTAPAVPSPAK